MRNKQRSLPAPDTKSALDHISPSQAYHFDPKAPLISCEMNRYMNYQYSNNNFLYNTQDSRTTSNLLSKQNLPNSAYVSAYGGTSPRGGLASARSSNVAQSSRYNEISSSRQTYKTELPWASSLASSSKYPALKSTNSNHLSSFANPTYQQRNNVSSTSLFTRYEPKPNYGQQSVNITSGGRSIFDYTPNRYDGQIKRSVTTKYPRTNYFSSQIDSKPLKHDHGYESSLYPNSESKHTVVALPKPTRSSSLKVRSIGSSILDHITASTFAKLKLRSSPSKSRSIEDKVDAKVNKLEIVRDEPEPDLLLTSDSSSRMPNVVTYEKNSSQRISAASPYSSSSGLSSSGVVGVSPSSSSSSRRQTSPTSTGNNKHKPSNLVATRVASNSSKNKEQESNFSEIDSAEVSLDYGTWSNEDDEEEQHTVVSPVTRRLKLLNQELGSNSLASRDNLIKTGAILSELRSFDEDLVDEESGTMIEGQDSDEKLEVASDEDKSTSSELEKDQSSTSLKADVSTFYVNLDAHRKSIADGQSINLSNIDDESSQSYCNYTEGIDAVRASQVSFLTNSLHFTLQKGIFMFSIGMYDSLCQ